MLLLSRVLLVSGGSLMKLRFELLTHSRAKSRFDSTARLLTVIPNESVGFNFALAIQSDNDDDRFQETPPTFTVNLIEPSSSGCSVTEWPFLRASSVAASTA